MITVGVIPWAQVFKGAKPLFYSPEVGGDLDFVSVHFYPKGGDTADSLNTLRVYDVGKPLVIEEIFPIHASTAETAEFIQRSAEFVEGYISFYWGKTIPQLEQSQELVDQLTQSWLKRFGELRADR